jgi:hypothetical protein
MGLFGKKFSGQNLLDFALGGTDAIDRRAALNAQAEQQQRQAAFYRAAPEMMNRAHGATGAANPIQVILEAMKAGLPTDGLLDAYKATQPKPHEYQGVNLGDGAFGSYDPQSNAFQLLREAPAPAPKPPQVVTGKDGIYVVDPSTGSTKKVGSWQPFAPTAPRKAAGPSHYIDPNDF